MITYKGKLDKYSLVKEAVAIPRVKISQSGDAVEYLRELWDNIDIYESFYLLTLNSWNNTTGFVKLAQGGINATLVDVELLMKYAIESLAVSIITAHNHPSGNTKPSKADLDMAKDIKEATILFKINYLDNLIIVPTLGYYSFTDEGLL